MSSKSLVINSPSLQTLRQKYVFTLLTFIVWMIWLVLWTPLITLVGWFAAFDTIYLEMVELEGYQEVMAQFSLFGICVLVIGSILGIWALYNFMRFKNVERRAAIVVVNNRQLAAFFGVDPATLAKMQKSQCFSVSFDAEGNIVDATEISHPPVKTASS